VDKGSNVRVEEQTIRLLPDTVTLRPFGVNIYSYPVQWPDFSRKVSR